MIFHCEKPIQKCKGCLKGIKNAFATIIIALAISARLVEGVDPGMECGGPLSSTPFVCIMSAIDYFNRCMFPTDKINSACLLNSCPKLNGINPINSDRSVNQAALSSIVTVLNDCLANTPSICGINVASTPIAHIEWILDQLLPTFLSINGSCKLNPNAGFVNHLNQAVFSLPAQQNANGPLTISFQNPNITQEATWNCSMSISTTLLRPLQPGTIQLFNFPEMHGITYISINPTLSIDLSGDAPSFSVVNDISNIKVGLSNFVSCVLDLPQVIVDLMNLSINKFFQQSTTNSYATNFLATFFTQGVNAAMQSCR